jgi:hypothetical protein
VDTALTSARGRSRSFAVLLVAVPLTLAVGLLAAVLLWPARPPRSAAPAGPRAAEVDQQVAAMQDEIRLLRRRLDHLVQQPPVAAAAPAASQAPPLTQEEVSARDKRRFEGLAAKLAGEPLDPGWAPATERLIADTLGKPEFKGSKLLSATCRSTLCRFEVGHQDERARRRFSSTLPNRLPSLPSGSMRNAEGNDTRTIVYVAREGHRIPRDDPQ